MEEFFTWKMFEKMRMRAKNIWERFLEIQIIGEIK